MTSESVLTFGNKCWNSRTAAGLNYLEGNYCISVYNFNTALPVSSLIISLSELV
jgi:hypothetical protein